MDYYRVTLSWILSRVFLCLVCLLNTGRVMSTNYGTYVNQFYTDIPSPADILNVGKSLSSTSLKFYIHAH